MAVNLIQGDAYQTLKTIKSESVDLICTSPPFFNQRRYTKDGSLEIGLERTINEYISNLLQVFDECKRILKNNGSFWLEINDSYNPKTSSLYGVPQRLYIQLLDRGWICRNEIIHYKRNCMPSSAKNRFTIDFSHFYWFTKFKKYKFNTQYEPMRYQYKNLEYSGQDTKDYHSSKAQSPSNSKRRILESYRKQMIRFGGTKYPNKVGGVYSGDVWKPNPQLKRIKRCVWDITVSGTRLAHVAAFTPELLTTPILACSNENDLILDPFTGISTVGLVALQNGRRFIGVDLNKEYLEMSKNRILKSCNLLPEQLSLKTLDSEE